MGGSFRRSLRPVWAARWQEVEPRLRFWLLLAGYDLRDRSRGDIFYIPYLIIFWFIWAFAMFAALSGVVARLLALLGPDSPDLAAAQLAGWALWLWAVVSLYQATRRSPIVFSAADGTLLCPTPVDRRAVVLIWFLSEWPGRVLPFAAGTLGLGFALYELHFPVERIDPAAVIGYTGRGLRAFSIVVPLHFLLLAVIWAAGVWRLQGRRARPLLRPLPLLIALLAVLVLVSGEQQAVAWPLLAAFALAPWLPALLAAIALALVALAILLCTAGSFSLSRAAQETSQMHSERFLARVGAREAAAQLKQVRQLGAESGVSRLPAGRGLWAVVGKDLARSARGWRAGVWSWLALLALGTGIAVAPDWGSRLVAAIFWVQLAAKRATALLRDNLAHWWLWRQQPFPAWQLVAGALAPPAALLVLLSLLAWAIGSRLPVTPESSVAPLLPLLAVLVTLAAAWDLLGRIEPAALHAGDTPPVSVAGLFQGLLLVGLLLGVVWGLARLTGAWWAGIVTSALLGLLLAVLLARLVARRARGAA